MKFHLSVLFCCLISLFQVCTSYPVDPTSTSSITNSKQADISNSALNDQRLTKDVTLLQAVFRLQRSKHVARDKQKLSNMSTEERISLVHSSVAKRKEASGLYRRLRSYSSRKLSNIGQSFQGLLTFRSASTDDYDDSHHYGAHSNDEDYHDELHEPIGESPAPELFVTPTEEPDFLNDELLFNFQPCLNTFECSGDRVCTDPLDPFKDCFSDSSKCICFPTSNFLCSSDLNCDVRETCARESATGFQVCVAKVIVSNSSDSFTPIIGNDPECEVDENCNVGEVCSQDGTCMESPSETEEPQQEGGLNLDVCGIGFPLCKGDRECKNDLDSRCGVDDLVCLCISPGSSSCENDTECDEGEACFAFTAESGDECISKAAITDLTGISF